jgi:5-methylcytosine-specific restriction endonuclease McrA
LRSVKPGRTTHRFRQMAAALRRERRDCWLCGQPINYEADRNDDDSFSVDHVRPLSTHPDLAEVYENLAAAHRRCNLSRGNRDPRPSLGDGHRQW